MKSALRYLLCSSFLVLILVMLIAAVAAAQSQPAHQSGDVKAKDPIPSPKSFVTEHQGTFNGVKISYTAYAGETYLIDKKG